MCAAEAGVSGKAPEMVRVRKGYSDEDDCKAEVEAHAEVTAHSLVVIISTEDGCSSSNRYNSAMVLSSNSSYNVWGVCVSELQSEWEADRNAG